MKTRVLSSAVWLCAAVALAETPAEKPSGENAAGKPPVLTPADEARRGQVLVSYQDGTITVGMLEDDVGRQNAFMRSRYKDRANLREVLDKMLRLRLLGDEAERRGYAKKELVQQSVKQNAVQMLMKAELDDKLNVAAIPKPEIEAYYKEHIDEYVQPALQRVSHIQVATEAEAKALLAQVKGMDLRAFRTLAREKSSDQATKVSGGDLRYFDASGKVRGEAPSTVPPAIAKAAFALKTVGDVAPAPIKTADGYSIVKLTGQRPALSRKLPEVQEAIRGRLWRDQRQAASEALVKQLEQKYPVELHAELLPAIKLETEDVPAGAAATAAAAAPAQAQPPTPVAPLQR